MRRETSIMTNIKRMYTGLNLEHNTVMHRAKLLLSIYRDVVWMHGQRVNDCVVEAHDLYGTREIGAALTFLSDFAPMEQRKDFEARVTKLFETQWLVELIDTAMLRVYNYPRNGKQYSEILSKSYMTFPEWTESELLEALNLERSAFYLRKKEAVMLFGIALWGYAIPMMKHAFNVGESLLAANA